MGRFLQAMFPGSAYVVVMRHPIVVALGTRKWRKLASATGRTTRRSSRWSSTGCSRTARCSRTCRTSTATAPWSCGTRTWSTRPDVELARVQTLLGLESPIPSGSITSRSGGYESEWAAMAHGNPLERRTRRRIESRFGAEIEAFLGLRRRRSAGRIGRLAEIVALTTNRAI